MNENLAYQEDWREELIGGRLVAMAPATIDHARIKRNVTTLLDNYLSGRTCEVLPDGAAVYLSENDYYYPDVVVVCDPDKIRADGVYGAPDLVVEVLSPGSIHYDRGRKKDVYEDAGVREYWIISPGDKSVEQYLLEGGRFRLGASCAVLPAWMLSRMDAAHIRDPKSEFKCSLYDDLVIRAADLFRKTAIPGS